MKKISEIFESAKKQNFIVAVELTLNNGIKIDGVFESKAETKTIAQDEAQVSLNQLVAPGSQIAQVRIVEVKEEKTVEEEKDLVEDCPECNGTGLVEGLECPMCRGTKTIATEEV